MKQSIWYWVKVLLSSGAALTLVILVISFFVGMPSGELRFGLARNVESTANDDSNPSSPETSAANRILHGFFTNVEDAKDLYAQLSFSDAFPLAADFHPPKPRYIGHRDVGDVVETFTLEQTAGGVEVKADGVQILRWLYDRLDLRDYYLVITSIISAPCPENECWTVTVNYSFGEHVDTEITGTEAEIKRDLAAFVVGASVRSAYRSWVIRPDASGDTPNFLTTLPESPNFEAWKSAAAGLEFLRWGQAATFCNSDGVERCRERAHEELKKATDLSPELGPAALGLALFDLHEVFKYAALGEQPIDIEKRFHQASTHAVRALQHEFVRGALVDGRFRLHEHSADLRGFPLTVDMVETSRSFACALAQYRRGEWGKCLEELPVLTNVAPLAPYVEMMRFDAKFHSSSQEDWPTILESLDRKIEEALLGDDKTKAALLETVRIPVVCQAVPDFSAQVDKVFEILPNNLTRALFALRVLHCAQGQDQIELENLVNKVSSYNLDSPMREMLELQKAIYSASTGSGDTALAHLKQAQLLPWSVQSLGRRGGSIGQQTVRRYYRDGQSPSRDDLWSHLEFCPLERL